MDAQWRAVDGTHETWQGPSGGALRTRFDGVHTKARQVLAALEDGRDAAKIASLNFTTATSVLRHAVDSATSAGFDVAHDGTCTISEKKKQAVYASVASSDRSGEAYSTAIAALTISCDAHTATIKRALNLAAEIDQQSQTAIDAAFANLPTPDSFGNATTPKSGSAPRPPKDGSPAENRAWWDSLTAAEKTDLISTQPASVGNLDGLPADARDRANRNLIPIERARLEQELAIQNGLVAADPRNARARTRSDELQERLDDLEAVAAQVDGRSDRKLLVFDM
ncbi:hypothetical protein [Nocardia crassostreae]|uniref:hypothetical protein n=1 Tax=Nocardia crassostreae TaxID=53428 RepID=UPI000834F457|nr:hypothetical protein [Nocardia crassostreae]